MVGEREMFLEKDIWTSSFSSSVFYCIKLIHRSSSVIDLSIGESRRLSWTEFHICSFAGLDEHGCKDNLFHYTLFSKWILLLNRRDRWMSFLLRQNLLPRRISPVLKRVSTNHRIPIGLASLLRPVRPVCGLYPSDVKRQTEANWRSLRPVGMTPFLMFKSLRRSKDFVSLRGVPIVDFNVPSSSTNKPELFVW